MFKRSYDGFMYTDQNNPATVSDFRMDSYEVTVGRFRKYVAAFPGNKPAAGAGKNPNNAPDPGWDATWNGASYMKADQASLIAAVKCHGSFQTWTDTPGGNENRPINCITWYEAFAFCIWDGGRLPSEAEWNYAAAGGSEQRAYPWSSAYPPGSSAIGCTNASYGCDSNACGDGVSGCALTDLIQVGTKPAGNGKWGQADMAGNVWEWVLDWHAGPYANPCDNCANLTVASDRGCRGGSFLDAGDALRAAGRNSCTPSYRGSYVGFRCARIP
jgi:formylglycine-generating enzyme required for sulfatase activity